MLDVYYDGLLLESIQLEAGSNVSYQVPVTPAAMNVGGRKDGSHELSFFLNAAIDCNYGFHHTTVSISANSQAIFPFSEQAIPLNLQRLPWPLYQPNAVFPNSAVVVTPKTPTPEELQAALLTMAAFGRLTARKLPMSLLTLDALTPEMKNASDVIFVGKAASFPLLAQIALPVPLVAQKYTVPGMGPDDGVLQMASSPWNPSRTVLIVGGNTDAALLKAAQALTTGAIQTAVDPATSLIANVNPLASSDANPASAVAESAAESPSSPDYALSDLGYGFQTSAGVGTNWFSYEFMVPPGQVPAEKPALDVVFSNSALLDPERSSMNFYLNQQLIGSARFSAENLNPNTAHVNLPLSYIRPGKNSFEVSADLIPTDVCSIVNFNNLWMMVHPESMIHLPLTAAVQTGVLIQDIKDYPYPFVNNPSLSTTTFIVPSNDPASWSIAAALAYDLGSHATGSIIAFDVAYDAETLSPTDQNNNLILIGLPSSLKVLDGFKDELPAYFDAGSNDPILKNQQVTYRIPPKKDIGYLELFSSPSNKALAVLSVLGTSPAGVATAGSALLTSKTLDNLKGNFATIDGEQALVADTRTGLGIGRVAASTDGTVVVEQLEPVKNVDAAVNTVAQTRQTIFISLIALTVLIGVVVLIAFVGFRRKPVTNKLS